MKKLLFLVIAICSLSYGQEKALAEIDVKEVKYVATFDKIEDAKIIRPSPVLNLYEYNVLKGYKLRLPVYIFDGKSEKLVGEISYVITEDVPDGYSMKPYIHVIPMIYKAEVEIEK